MRFIQRQFRVHSITLLAVAVVAIFWFFAQPPAVEVRPDAGLPTPRAVEVGNLGPTPEDMETAYGVTDSAMERP